MKNVVLYWDHTGPLLRYSEGFLVIEDLNPEVKTKWRMTRREMFVVGWRFIKAAIMG